MTNKSILWLFVILVFVMPVTSYVVYTWYGKSYQRLPVVKQLNITERQLPSDNFTLLNQENKPVGMENWKGKIVVVNFFFTHCPVVCPRMMKNLQKLQTRLKTDTTLLINSFTVDPESDSVTQLKEYAIRFQYDLHNWNLLTGAKKDIYRLARNSFDVAATDGDGGETDFIHSEQIILVDKQLRIRGYYKGTDETQVDQLANDIKKLENEKD